MLVVVASRRDAGARALCERAAPGTAALLDWRDLSTPGWSYYADRTDGQDEVVIGGTRIASEEVTAVVTRCASVPPHELSHIVPADRAYVAAEMTALLLAWLARLHCPVVNRPNAGSLCGPRWPPERWTALASALGIAVLPLARRATPGLAPSIPRPGAPRDFEHRSVTVVGARATQTGRLTSSALAMASAAGAALLRVHFAIRGADHHFLGADLDVDLAAPPVAEALLEHLGIQIRAPASAAP